MTSAENNWLQREDEWFAAGEKEAVRTVGAAVGVLAVVADTLYERTSGTREFLERLAFKKAAQLYRRGMGRRF